MKKLVAGLVLVTAVATAGAANAATVTHATLPSGIFDEATETFYPMTCDEIQIINGNHRKETFHCTFDEAAPEHFAGNSSDDLVWFSDFDGAEAISTHWAITAAGTLQGWALYS